MANAGVLSEEKRGRSTILRAVLLQLVIVSRALIIVHRDTVRPWYSSTVLY